MKAVGPKVPVEVPLVAKTKLPPLIKPMPLTLPATPVVPPTSGDEFPLTFAARKMFVGGGLVKPLSDIAKVNVPVALGVPCKSIDSDPVGLPLFPVVLVIDSVPSVVAVWIWPTVASVSHAALSTQVVPPVTVVPLFVPLKLIESAAHEGVANAPAARSIAATLSLFFIYCSFLLARRPPNSVRHVN